MISFEISHADSKVILQNMAAALNIAYTGEDFIMVTPPIGKGIIKVLTIAEELQVIMADVTLSQHLLVKRMQSARRYFVLHFDDVFSMYTTISANGEALHKANIRHSVVRLTSNAFSNTEEIPANTCFKTVKILFSEDWLKKYLGLTDGEDALQKYLAIKAESFDMEQLDAVYLKLMDELWIVQKDDPLQNIFLQNRVTLLIERFFTLLYNKMNLLQSKFNLSSEVIKTLVNVEQLLVTDFKKLPPTIDEFSKLVSMSSTKLKKSFRSMYGDSIYSYYQKQRLQKANELLLGGKHNIKQVAEAVGYNNVSNFTLAYKKRFKKVPGNILSAQ
ncbi:helix-turn-helix domain-containing protein [Ferruginibacter sp.]|nr:helix-turn-helix transcriptional regulator [Ferruginibacter sp.]